MLEENKESPPWVSHIVVEKEEPKLWKVRKPKDLTTDADLGQMVAHTATHDKDVKYLENAIVEHTISDILRKKMQMPSPIRPKVEGEEVMTRAESIAETMLQKAEVGDLSTIREVLNRTEGKVPNITHNESKSLKLSATTDGLAALFQQLDRNKG